MYKFSHFIQRLMVEKKSQNNKAFSATTYFVRRGQHGDLVIKSPFPNERVVQRVRVISCSQHYYPFLVVKTVHFRQQLVYCRSVTRETWGNVPL